MYKENFNIYIFAGTERIINTKSTTVVDDIIDELCNVIGVETVSKINYRESLDTTDFGEQEIPS